ncbi:HAD family hydrolase [Streptomyces sp. NPDC060184]|uniref:HAD family hydrolase n=1 Tax=Streptomyces sp. NPDC060184 TaxID=3347064 RepID=UPI003666190D
MNESARAAFFDVDETLITAKSMFDFLHSWIVDRGGEEEEYAAVMRQVHAMAASGTDRTEINRFYYRRFAGVSQRELTAAARAWYDAYRLRPDGFVRATVSALRAHVAAGDTVVLVSGSFRGCLEPLTGDLPAHRILCSEPLVDGDGLLTGEVERPMIGTAKGQALGETVRELGFAFEDCHAYGDHASDLTMLTQVGHPHAVGADPVLDEYAVRLGWDRLPAAPAALAELDGLYERQPAVAS